MKTRLDAIREKHVATLGTDDIQWLLDLATQIDRFWCSDWTMIDMSDTSLSASDELDKLLNEEGQCII